VKLAVIEPAYFPPPSYFAKALCADVLVWADSFQFRKGGFINRAPIKTVSGKQWLTVPVFSKMTAGQKINDAVIDNQQNWQNRHLRSLEVNYRQSPYYPFYTDAIAEIINGRYQTVSGLLAKSRDFLFSQLRINKKIIPGSQLPHIPDRTERLIAWLKECDCQSYVHYEQERPLFNNPMVLGQGIQLFTCRYEPQKYHQIFGDFLPDLSVLDLLFNEGEQALAIIRQGMSMRESLK
jgi:hypothetical protein